MLDQDRAVLFVAIHDGVGPDFAGFAFRQEKALRGPQLDKHTVRRFRGGNDFGSEIERIRDETFLLRLQVKNPGIPGIGRTLKEGDRPLHEMQPGRVLQTQPQERIFRLIMLVVNGDPTGFDRLAHDGQHRRFLALQCDETFDAVLVILAELGGVGDRFHPFAELEFLIKLPFDGLIAFR